MTTWWDNRLVAYDCETTGVNVETDRIVSAAVVLCGGGEPTDVFTILIDPGVEIPEEATLIHGITNERAEREGVSSYNGISVIWDRLMSADPGWPIIVKNTPFDLTILDRELARHRLGPRSLLRERYVIDPGIIDKHLDRYRKGSRKLHAVCDHYGATLDNAHNAEADAIAAARLAWVMGKHGVIVRRSPRSTDEFRETAALHEEWRRIRGDLAGLHEAQRRWAYAQAAGLEQHFTKTGHPQAVPRDWPVIAEHPEGQNGQGSEQQQRVAA